MTTRIDAWWWHHCDITSSSEPNRSMSSSSSSSFEAGVEPEVVSATPAGPYWPRGFFTPGRLTQEAGLRHWLQVTHTQNTTHNTHLFFWLWYDLMWLYQRRAWHRSAEGAAEIASKTATSAWEGTYLRTGSMSSTHTPEDRRHQCVVSRLCCQTYSFW